MNTAGRHLVFTADDFGLSPSVDAAILEAFQHGVVRSTALLVNFPDFRESLRRLNQQPELEVGIHLNLTAGPPVSPPGEVESLLEGRQQFPGLSTLLRRCALGQINPEHVRTEWAAQISKGLSFGVRLVAINGHQHVHMLPRFAEIALELAKKFNISLVRLSRYHARSIVRPFHAKGWLISCAALRTAGMFRRSAVRYNDYVLPIPPGNSASAITCFQRWLRHLTPGVYEVISHPGRIDDLLRERDPYCEGRPAELALLTSPNLPRVLQEEGIEYSGFRRLLEGKRSDGQTRAVAS